jgi:hypothetical protein
LTKITNIYLAWWIRQFLDLHSASYPQVKLDDVDRKCCSIILAMAKVGVKPSGHDMTLLFQVSLVAQRVYNSIPLIDRIISYALSINVR